MSIATTHKGAAEISLRDNGRWFVSASSPKGSFVALYCDTREKAFAFASEWCRDAEVEAQHAQSSLL